MLSAIAEAKDDHLCPSEPTITQSGSPWNLSNSTEQSFVNHYFDMDTENDRLSSTTTCCCVPKFSRTGYLRSGRTKGDSEDYACLIDCDELEHTTRNTMENNNNTSVQFEDDFV